MIVYNYDADLEVSDTCVRSSLLSWVEYATAWIYDKFIVQFAEVKLFTIDTCSSAKCTISHIHSGYKKQQLPNFSK